MGYIADADMEILKVEVRKDSPRECHETFDAVGVMGRALAAQGEAWISLEAAAIQIGMTKWSKEKSLALGGMSVNAVNLLAEQLTEIANPKRTVPVLEIKKDELTDQVNIWGLIPGGELIVQDGGLVYGGVGVAWTAELDKRSGKNLYLKEWNTRREGNNVSVRRQKRNLVVGGVVNHVGVRVRYTKLGRTNEYALKKLVVVREADAQPNISFKKDGTLSGATNMGSDEIRVDVKDGAVLVKLGGVTSEVDVKMPLRVSTKVIFPDKTQNQEELAAELDRFRQFVPEAKWKEK
jgi:hypothetical protein